MATSTITVAGINPALNILGATQQFNYNQSLSAFQLNNIFIPTSLVASQTNYEVRNNLLSGFRWVHLTSNTDTYGTFKLQSFVSASPTGSDLISFSSSGIKLYNTMNLNSYKIINLLDPTNAQDAATKNYIDTGFIAGIATGVNPGNVPVFDGATGRLIKDSGIYGSSIVIGPNSAISSNIAIFNGITGALIKDSGINVTNSLIDIATRRIINVVNPTSAQDAATKYYVDNAGGTITLIGDISGSGLLNSSVTTTLANTIVTPGTYTYGTFTVNSQGRLTSASSGTAPVTSVSGGTGITITGSTTPSVAITNTAVTAGNYTYGSFTVNAQGQLTSASSGTAPVTSVSGGAGITVTGTTTPTIAVNSSVVTAIGIVTAPLAATCGTGTLNGITGVTISTTAVLTGSIVHITRNSGASLTNAGAVSVGNISSGASFDVYSSNAADTGTFFWQVINPA